MVENKIKLLTIGELLLRMSTTNGFRFSQTNDFRVQIGGAEANVCVLLSQLGVETEFLSRIPANDLATLALNELKKYNVNVSNCSFGGERMGLYFVENGNQIRQTQVIYDRSNSSFSTIQKEDVNWQKAFEQATHFHWSGISPAISQKAAEVCKQGILLAHEKGLVISSDFNYRSKLWQYGKKPSEIMPELLQFSRIIVADLDAVEIYFGIKTDKKEKDSLRFENAYIELKKHMPYLETLAMSFRKSEGLTHTYSAMLMNDNVMYESQQHKIHLVTDQIGSGDAFTAGLLYGLMNNLEPQETIEWATACGVIKQSVSGDFAITGIDEVKHFLKEGVSNRIGR